MKVLQDAAFGFGADELGREFAKVRDGKEQPITSSTVVAATAVARRRCSIQVVMAVLGGVVAAAWFRATWSSGGCRRCRGR